MDSVFKSALLNLRCQLVVLLRFCLLRRCPWLHRKALPWEHNHKLYPALFMVLTFHVVIIVSWSITFPAIRGFMLSSIVKRTSNGLSLSVISPLKQMHSCLLIYEKTVYIITFIKKTIQKHLMYPNIPPKCWGFSFKREVFKNPSTRKWVIKQIIGKTNYRNKLQFNQKLRLDLIFGKYTTHNGFLEHKAQLQPYNSINIKYFTITKL